MATDTGGYAGLADQVDFHTWKLLKGVALATILGVGSQLGFRATSTMPEMNSRTTAAPPISTLRFMRVTGCGRARSSSKDERGRGHPQ